MTRFAPRDIGLETHLHSVRHPLRSRKGPDKLEAHLERFSLVVGRCDGPWFLGRQGGMAAVVEFARWDRQVSRARGPGITPGVRHVFQGFAAMLDEGDAALPVAPNAPLTRVRSSLHS